MNINSTRSGLYPYDIYTSAPYKEQRTVSLSGFAVSQLSFVIFKCICYIYSLTMQQSDESYLSSFLKIIANRSRLVFEYCKKSSEQHIASAVQKAQPLLNSGKQFYKEHQKVILIALTATVVYIVFGIEKKQEEDKPKKKKQGVNKIQIAGKTFASHDSEEEYKEVLSTSVRVESSGKEVNAKKRIVQRALEKIQSSSQQQETGDKIFFEVYKQYQGS